MCDLRTLFNLMLRETAIINKMLVYSELSIIRSKNIKLVGHPAGIEEKHNNLKEERSFL